MINKIPFIGWLLSFISSVSLSVPFYICWTSYGLGAEYFYFLPQKFQQIPFWNCVGLFIIIGILKCTIVPQFASISQTNTKKKKACKS